MFYAQFRMYGSRVRPVNPQISLLAMALRPLRVKATLGCLNVDFIRRWWKLGGQEDKVMRAERFKSQH